MLLPRGSHPSTCPPLKWSTILKTHYYQNSYHHELSLYYSYLTCIRCLRHHNLNTRLGQNCFSPGPLWLQLRARLGAEDVLPSVLLTGPATSHHPLTRAAHAKPKASVNPLGPRGLTQGLAWTPLLTVCGLSGDRDGESSTRSPGWD